MVVKKRLSPSSFDKDEECFLPFVNEGETELKQPKIIVVKRPIHHESFDDGESTSWRPFSGKKQELVLPTFTTCCNPQTADVVSPKTARSKLVFTARKRKATVFTFIAFAVVFGGLFSYKSSKTTLHDILDQVDEIAQNRKTLLLKVRGAEKDVRVLEREVSALESMHRRRLEQVDDDTADSGSRTRVVEHSVSLKQLEEMKLKMAKSHEHANALRERVQSLSQHEAKKKYGTGPHRVKVTLDFPDGPSSFVVELASLDVMPHSVETFLGMVSAGLWDGCSFVMNAMHVIKAAPLPYDGSPAADKVAAFEEHGLSRLSFNEYSEDVPHEAFTIGFAGGDSPSWYINTEDNQDVHNGDPCFGKVIEGFDTIKKLEHRPTKDGIWYEERVGIKQAKIV